MTSLNWGWMIGFSTSETASKKKYAVAHITSWKTCGRSYYGETQYRTACGRKVGLRSQPLEHQAEDVRLCQHCAAVVTADKQIERTHWRWNGSGTYVMMHWYVGASLWRKNGSAQQALQSKARLRREAEMAAEAEAQEA